MSLIFIFVFLLIFGWAIYYVINLLIKRRLTENFDNQGKYMPSEAIHYFLTTSVRPGKQNIVNLQETNPNHTRYSYLTPKDAQLEQPNRQVVSHRQSKLDPRNLTCVGSNAPIRKLVQEFQPYMYDQPELINLYDYPFYRDWRYPERPIDPRFLINPDKYCQENPQIYPSYKHLSKW
jgi:hypothetical protein|uniref:Uncharacterized protein n=1 Tax=viral metagenome TaxID=1070528 RepID=A0A6C0BL59_9ZZZZ